MEPAGSVEYQFELFEQGAVRCTHPTGLFDVDKNGALHHYDQTAPQQHLGDSIAVTHKEFVELRFAVWHAEQLAHRQRHTYQRECTVHSTLLHEGLLKPENVYRLWQREQDLLADLYEIGMTRQEVAKRAGKVRLFKAQVRQDIVKEYDRLCRAARKAKTLDDIIEATNRARRFADENKIDFAFIHCGVHLELSDADSEAYRAEQLGSWRAPVADFNQEGVFRVDGKSSARSKIARAVARSQRYVLSRSWTAKRGYRVFGFQCGVELGKKFSFQEVMAFPNVHKRQIAIEQSGGWITFVKELKLVEKTELGALYSAAKLGVKPRLLVLRCPSTRKNHALLVPAGTRTVRAALLFVNRGIPEEDFIAQA